MEHVTFRKCAEGWLTVARATVKPQSLVHYEANLRIHVLPAFGDRRINRIQRGAIKEFLSNELNSGLKPKTVGHLQSTIYGIFQHAIDMGAVESNPTIGLAKKLRLKRLSRSERVRPFDEEGLQQLLEAAMNIRPGKTANRIAAAGRDYPLLFTMACTGTRINEALALQVPDLDFNSRHIHIRRIFVNGKLDSPKTENSQRSVDMSRGLRELLWEMMRKRKEEKLKYGWAEMPPWVFCGPEGRPMRDHSVQARFKKILEAAGLPACHSPHDLRHTFACLHLSRGANIYYVQRQLGHASIQMTVDLYGRWAQTSNHDAADRLDEVFCSQQKSLFEIQ